MKRRLTSVVLGTACAILLDTAAFAGDGGDAFTYQGQLQQSGAAASGPLDLVFRLFNAAEGGTQIGSALTATDFTDFDDAGRFTVELAFGPTAFPGAARWLEITVEGVTLAPRQRINPVPYATRSLEVAQVGSSALSGSYANALTMTNGANQFGGTFNGTHTGAFSGTHSGSGASLTQLNASNIANGTLAGAILSGTYGNALTMTNGANQFGGTFNGTHTGNGANLTALHAGNVTTGTLNPARLPVNGDWPLFGPLSIDTTTIVVDPTANRVGIGTAAPQQALSLVGGANVDQNNGNTGTLANSLRFGSFSGEAIGSNRGAGENSFGLDLWAGASKRMSITNDGKIGIGTSAPTARLHMAASTNGTALDLPGVRVIERSEAPIVLLGKSNNGTTATTNGVAIGGGGWNSADANYSTIGGGTGNEIDFGGAYSTIAGGNGNNLFAAYGAIGGGLGNEVLGEAATVAGGEENKVYGAYCAIGGGYFNGAESFYATVIGGFNNYAGAESATVAGGEFNLALGRTSLSCGSRAEALHDGAFVWSDRSGSAFKSTGNGQFLVRANGGVGINTNTPTSSLEVSGGIRARGGSPGGAGANNNGFAFNGNGGDNDSGMFSSADGQLEFHSNATEIVRITSGGNVGIGTTTPGARLEVNGSAAKPGGGLWSVSSDIRLKKDIAPLAHALDDLLRLRGVTYAYIDPAAINELEGTRMGFIAQDVEEVFPDWVDEGSRGFKRLTIRGFEALAVEAIRALRAEKDAQLAERDALLAAQQQAMAERDAVIADHQATIAKLEHSIAASASTVAAHAADFDALAQRVKELEGTIGSLMQERRESRR